MFPNVKPNSFDRWELLLEGSSDSIVMSDFKTPLTLAVGSFSPSSTGPWPRRCRLPGALGGPGGGVQPGGAAAL